MKPHLKKQSIHFSPNPKQIKMKQNRAEQNRKRTTHFRKRIKSKQKSCNRKETENQD